MQFLKSKNKSALTVFGLTVLVVSAALWFDEKRLDENSLNENKFDEISTNKNDSINFPSSPIAEAPQQRDYFMENYNIISTDTNGRAYQWLSGDKLSHFPDGDTILVQPKLQFSQENQHWLLLADNGNIHKNKKITLDGAVRIQQLNGKTKALNIQTEHLDISLSNNTASTTNPVVVSDENGTINATGMNINFDEHQLRLLSNVKGRYAFQ